MTTDTNEIEQLQAENTRLQRLIEEAQAESRGLRRLAQTSMGRWLLPGTRRALRFLGRRLSDQWPDPHQLGEWSVAGVGDVLTADSGPLSSQGIEAFNPFRRTVSTLAICHPDWRGVRSSVENLFDTRLFLRDDLTLARAALLARWIEGLGVETIVLNGFPAGYALLIKRLQQKAAHIRILAIWHGNFMQLDEPAEWRGLNDLIDSVRSGTIARAGFVKEGMAEVFARYGMQAFFIMNYVRRIPVAASHPDPGGPHLGLWAIEPIWRKLPYTMLAAAALIPGAQVWGTGQNPRAIQLADRLGLPLHKLASGPLPRAEMQAALARMHLNLYVTLSECTPMLPLESLAAGTPCLVGPTSHLFRDEASLRHQLVVSYPDNPTVLADQIFGALADRASIVQRYAQYAVGYNQLASRTLAAFLASDE